MTTEASDACEIARLPEELLSAALALTTPRHGRPRRRNSSSSPIAITPFFSPMASWETCAKCYMLSARALHISWGDTPRYWRWIHLPAGYRYVARYPAKCSLKARLYAAYIVFKTTDQSTGLH
ncbi:hypothetical protein BS78_04G315800 [Paspalum vaginatum]|nr:hypothetical protein BS78_04G315800 [Paspalum vaginatum]